MRLFGPVINNMKFLRYATVVDVNFNKRIIELWQIGDDGVCVLQPNTQLTFNFE